MVKNGRNRYAPRAPINAHESLLVPPMLNHRRVRTALPASTHRRVGPRMPLNDFSVICPCNDAESYTVVQIARRLHLDIRVSPQRTWFCPLDREPPATFRDLRRRIIIVEMPGPSKEEELRALHEIFIVDHHDYPSLGYTRENERSSLEQFAQLVGYQLTREEQAVAINDQLYIYGLVDAGFSKEEIVRVRTLDLTMQGYTDAMLTANEADLETRVILPTGITRYRSSLPKFAYLIDLHVLRNDCRRSNIVVTGSTGDNRGAFMYFSGDQRIINRLKNLGGFSKKSAASYGLWGGYEFGAERVDLLRADDMLTNVS